MVIEKIINNNIVSCYDESHSEVVVMGRGLGFKRKPGEEIDNEKIEKIFRMENLKETKHLEEVLADIPIEHIQLSNDIVGYASTIIKNKLSKNIYITLTDHLNYAIERYHAGIQMPNPLKWEIKKFYNIEYKVGEQAVDMVLKRLGILLSEDEAASIALHFVNAELGFTIPNTIDITKLIQNVFKIVTYHFQFVIDEDTIDYERFLTHLKFFSQRVISGKYNLGTEDELYQLMKQQYPNAFACAEKIRLYIEQEYKVELPKEEVVYLTIHIKRIIKNCSRESSC